MGILHCRNDKLDRHILPVNGQQMSRTTKMRDKHFYQSKYKCSVDEQIIYSKKSVMISQHEIQQDQLSDSSTIILQRKINKGEQKRFFIKSNRYPQSAVGMICARASYHSDKYVWGTGFLVSGKFVVTCAHNVCKKYRGKSTILQVVQFHIKICGMKQSSKQVFQVSNVFVPNQYLNITTSDANAFDFALLQLKVNNETSYFLQRKNRFLKLSIQNIKPGSKIYICGFPQDLNQDSDQKQMYGSIGNISDLQSIDRNSGKMAHYADTSYGNSGSPIIFLRGIQSEVIGIHTSASANSLQNYALPIRKDILKMFNKWTGLNFQKVKNNLRESRNVDKNKTLPKKILDTQTTVASFHLSHVKIQGGQYYGQTLNNMRHGTGRIDYSKQDRFGRISYSGSWKQDQRHGFGILITKDQEYRGNWKNNCKDGKGRLTDREGQYDGYFTKNIKSGQGEFVYVTGQRYIGNWYDDQLNGHGQLHLLDGSVLRGKFVNGLLQGEVIVESQKGQKIREIFVNGRKQRQV